MVSLYPDKSSLNISYLWNKHDLRQNSPCPFLIDKESIAGKIFSNKNLSNFASILNKSGLITRYTSKQANCTLFASINRSTPNSSLMTIGDCVEIIRLCTLNRKIDSDLLTQSPCSKFNTRNNDHNLLIINVNGKTTINNVSNIINFDIKCNNGLIHIVDNILIPLDQPCF